MIKTSGTAGYPTAEVGGDERRLGVSGVGGVRMSGTGVCFAERELVLGAEIWGGVRFSEGFFLGFGSVMLGTAGIGDEDGNEVELLSG